MSVKEVRQMNRAEMHTTHHRGTAAKDVETWLGNSLATILAGLAVAAGVVGMLMVFGYVNEDSTAPFEDGLTWMIGGLILAICANVFRREHHVVDLDDRRQTFARMDPPPPTYRDRPEYTERSEYAERDYPETRRYER
jgi:hypothetical protein